MWEICLIALLLDDVRGLFSWSLRYCRILRITEETWQEWREVDITVICILIIPPSPLFTLHSRPSTPLHSPLSTQSPHSFAPFLASNSHRVVQPWCIFLTLVVTQSAHISYSMYFVFSTYFICWDGLRLGLTWLTKEDCRATEEVVSTVLKKMPSPFSTSFQKVLPITCIHAASFTYRPLSPDSLVLPNNKQTYKDSFTTDNHPDTSTAMGLFPHKLYCIVARQVLPRNMQQLHVPHVVFGR